MISMYIIHIYIYIDIFIDIYVASVPQHELGNPKNNACEDKRYRPCFAVADCEDCRFVDEPVDFFSLIGHLKIGNPKILLHMLCNYVSH